MRKQGFTLLEVMVIVIIIGVLSTLGLVQYQKAVERSRGAEARMILAEMARRCEDIWVEEKSAGRCGDWGNNVWTGTANDQYPSVCRPSHYFRYFCIGSGGTGGYNPSLTCLAYRCASGGKSPDMPGGKYMSYTTNYAAGTDSYWTNGPW